VKTDSFVIEVRVAQRTNGADQRDVQTSYEVGQQLLEALHACGASDSGFLVEAEIVAGNEAGAPAQVHKDMVKFDPQDLDEIPVPNVIAFPSKAKRGLKTATEAYNEETRRLARMTTGG
jgi:hypothetical protein